MPGCSPTPAGRAVACSSCVANRASASRRCSATGASRHRTCGSSRCSASSPKRNRRSPASNSCCDRCSIASPGLPTPQAGALRSALGLEGGREATPFLVYLATLTLLSDVAGERPLLCLIDDAQWLDDGSADAMVFVARRLGAEPIAMLLAARDGEGHRFDPALPDLRLVGLDTTSAEELLDQQPAVVLAPQVRRHLIEGSGANPLALLELPSTLTAAQRDGREPIFDPLPVGTRVERAFLARCGAFRTTRRPCCW